MRLTAVISVGAVLWTGSAVSPSSAAAQLSDPCHASCAVVLGLSASAVGMAGLVASARHSGGVSTVPSALAIMGGGFALSLGAGLALGGNGDRQRRAVLSSGVGIVGGSLAGIALSALRSGSDGPRLLAGALVGAGVGVLIGGVYGALTYDAPTTTLPQSALVVPLFSFQFNTP